MLDAGQSTHSISAATGILPFTILRLRFKEYSKLQKSTDGCSKKLSSSNIHYAIHLISTPLKGQKMLSRSPNLSPAFSINLSPPAPFIFTSKKLVWRLWSRSNALSSLMIMDMSFYSFFFPCLSYPYSPLVIHPHSLSPLMPDQLYTFEPEGSTILHPRIPVLGLTHAVHIMTCLLLAVHELWIYT